jgi:hypothetical protein
MAKKMRGLGRGLEALLPDAEEVLSSGVQEISLGDIDPNPDQPRRTFSEESIAQLAQSIREQGVLQPEDMEILAKEVDQEMKDAIAYGMESPRPDVNAFLKKIQERYAV